MIKPLKLQRISPQKQLIKNQWRAALVQIAQATPLVACATRRARRDPPGGHDPRHSLPPSVTPYGLFGFLCQKTARNFDRGNGVRGGKLSPASKLRIMGVRT